MRLMVAVEMAYRPADVCFEYEFWMSVPSELRHRSTNNSPFFAKKKEGEEKNLLRASQEERAFAWSIQRYLMILRAMPVQYSILSLSHTQLTAKSFSYQRKQAPRSFVSVLPTSAMGFIKQLGYRILLFLVR